jgi:hypothetical protein
MKKYLQHAFIRVVSHALLTLIRAPLFDAGPWGYLIFFGTAFILPVILEMGLGALCQGLSEH